MKRKIAVLTLCALLIALCGSVNAQQPGKVFRIGFLDASTASGRRSVWRHSGRSCSSLDGLKEKTSPSNIGLQSKSLSAYLSLPLTWFA